MKKSFEKLQILAERIAELDDRVIEVFVHSDSPKDPLGAEEVFLVCHVGDPTISNDLELYEGEGYGWGLEMQEGLQPVIETLGIELEVVVSAFNFKLYNAGEYGSYFHTLFLREGYTPVLQLADQQQKEREKQILDELDLSRIED